MRMKLLLVSIMTIFTLMFTGCDKKQVPPGTVAKIMTENGYGPEVLNPGWYKVCSIIDFNCRKKLITLETFEKTYVEDATIRMKDNLDLKVKFVRIRVKVDTANKKAIDALFNSVQPNKNNMITIDKVYQTYGKLIVTRDLREILSKYTLDDVRLNYSKVVGEVYNKIKKDFKATPLLVLDVSIGKLEYPRIYTDAVLEAKRKELEIKKAKAEAAIKLTRIKAQMEIAKAEYAIKMQEAKRISDYNKLIGSSVSSQLLELRKLEVQQSLVENLKNNSNVVYMPLPMINNSNYLLQLKGVK